MGMGNSDVIIPNTPVVGTVSAHDEKRRKEKEQDRCILGMLMGGCLIALCVGKEKAVNCGVNLMDTLLCMNCDCGGF
jgi:hypothetical protein